MTPTHPRRLKSVCRRSLQTLTLGSCLRPLHTKSRKCGRRERFKRMTAVSEHGSKKSVRFRKLCSADSAWKRTPSSTDAKSPVFRMLRKRREPRHGQAENSVPKTVPVGCEMGWYLAEVAALAGFKRNCRPRLALQDDDSKSSSSAAVALVRFIFINK